MNLNEFFRDLEDQFDASLLAAQRQTDDEEQRLTAAQQSLQERLRALSADGPQLRVQAAGSWTTSGVLTTVGADWIALRDASAVHFVRREAIRTITARGHNLATTAKPVASLLDRMTWGYLLRDVARRRVAVTVRLNDGELLNGTMDRAGADHADFAVHEPGEYRRARAVRDVYVLAFSAMSVVTVNEESSPDFAG